MAENIPSRLADIESLLQGIYKYLHPYLPLANINTVGFYTENLWSLIPSEIRTELLSLSDQELSRLPTGQLFYSDGNADSVNQGSSPQMFESGSEERINDRELCPQNVSLAVNQDIKAEKSISCDGYQTIKKFQALHTFFLEAQKYTLLHFGMVKRIEDVLFQDVAMTTEKRCSIVGFGMTQKKYHEVTLMSDIVNQLANTFDIKQVIDIGSGKGYLSQHLSLQHGLHVLGIDASTTNTVGALERNRKLQKFWPGLLRNANKSKMLSQSNEVCKCKHKDNMKANFDKSVQDEVRKSQFPTAGTSTDQTICHHRTSDSNVCSKEDIQTTMIVDKSSQGKQHSDINGQSEVESFENSDWKSKKRNTICEVCKKKLLVSYNPVTAFVDVGTDLSKMRLQDSKDDVMDNKDSDEEETSTHDELLPQSTLLTGLHTCGDLAATILRLFSHDPSTKVLCSVGCCFNLLTEEFDDEPPWGVPPGAKTVPGFPMSDILKSQKAIIGRGARRLACSSNDKSVAENKLPSNSLFIRAVLQVIIEDHYESFRGDRPVGKTAAKCRTFLEYVRKALKKLHLDDTKLSDDEIMDYYHKYESEERKLSCFIQFRAIIAPVLEGFIVLDRLAFLLQQEDVDTAHIVRIFDPIRSPRCHAIIATKK
ncbi:putative methyltransferase-like protein 25 [Glandiceps talaboti]